MDLHICFKPKQRFKSTKVGLYYVKASWKNSGCKNPTFVVTDFISKIFLYSFYVSSKMYSIML